MMIMINIERIWAVRLPLIASKYFFTIVHMITSGEYGDKGMKSVLTSSPDLERTRYYLEKDSSSVMLTCSTENINVHFREQHHFAGAFLDVQPCTGSLL